MEFEELVRKAQAAKERVMAALDGDDGVELVESLAEFNDLYEKVLDAQSEHFKQAAEAQGLLTGVVVKVERADGSTEEIDLGVIMAGAEDLLHDGDPLVSGLSNLLRAVVGFALDLHRSLESTRTF